MMNFKHKIVAFACILGFTSALYADADAPKMAGLELPGVPIKLTDPPRKSTNLKAVKVADKSTSKAPTPAKKRQGKPQPKNMANSYRGLDLDTIPVQPPEDLLVSPGVNEFIPISRGYLNRITTPFEKPKIATVSDITTEIKGSTVYVATNSNRPVGLYITEDGDETQAISLTLFPKSQPPREINLRFAPVSKGMVVSKSAKRWEESQPYVDMIKLMMKKVAKGQIPQGYTLTDVPDNADENYRCNQPNLEVIPLQNLEGNTYRVIVFQATNVGDESLEINESSCYHTGVSAVAPWPYAELLPGQQTEIYLVENKALIESTVLKRPSVIGR